MKKPKFYFKKNMEGGPLGKMDIQPSDAPEKYQNGVKNEIPFRALPKALFPYYSMDLIKDPEISIEEKLIWLKHMVKIVKTGFRQNQ